MLEALRQCLGGKRKQDTATKRKRPGIELEISCGWTPDTRGVSAQELYQIVKFSGLAWCVVTQGIAANLGVSSSLIESM